MRNWKTTLLGALAAVATAIQTQAMVGNLGDWRLWILPALLAGWGAVQKDHNVTGN